MWRCSRLRTSAGGKVPKDLNLVSLEVQALQAIDTLELTPKQLMPSPMAKETKDKSRKREPAKVTPPYRQALLDLHAALVKKDEEKISELDAKLDELGTGDTQELDTEVDVTEAALKKAPELLKMLSAAQVSGYLTTLSIPDPLEELSEALETGRVQKGKEWAETRDDVAAEVGKLIGGVTQKKIADATAQLKTLLDKAHAAKATKATEEMEQLVTKTGPFIVLRNTVEHGLAEMLSNLRLGPAIEARKAATKRVTSSSTPNARRGRSVFLREGRIVPAGVWR